MSKLNHSILVSVVAVLFGLATSSAYAQAGHPEVPRLSNGKPDLSGTWDNGSGIDFVQPVVDGASICVFGCPQPADADPAASRPPAAPDRPSYRPAFFDDVAELDAKQVEFDPVLRCMPPGVPRIGPPDKIVQLANEVVFLYDDVSGNFFRIIPTDGRKHRTDIEPSFLGDAIGSWDGDTLVVETVNFNGETWLTDDGSFHTASLRVVERLSRDADTLTWEATAHDPEVLAEPWTMRPRTAHATTDELVEAPPCIDRDLEHMLDGSSHDNPR